LLQSVTGIAECGLRIETIPARERRQSILTAGLLKSCAWAAVVTSDNLIPADFTLIPELRFEKSA
jgi:hypothetical protein